MEPASLPARVWGLRMGDGGWKMGPTDPIGQFAHPGLTVERLPGQAGLRILGEVDMATSSDWVGVLVAVRFSGAIERLDLSGLSFIDVRGVASLVEAARLLPSRPLTLSRPPSCLRRILDTVWSNEATHIVVEDDQLS